MLKEITIAFGNIVLRQSEDILLCTTVTAKEIAQGLPQFLCCIL